MLRLSMDDLRHGDGVKTGLPKGLVGGMRINSPEMPVCAVGRDPRTDVTISYALARGCVKLLDGDLTICELIGSGNAASGVHVVLANGKSHGWIVTEDTDSGRVLFLRGMPYSSPVVNYNAGLALGLYLMLNREHYPSFAKAVGEAVTAKAGNDPQTIARSLALMTDEMAYAVERMIDGNDPTGIQAVVLDREQPAGYDSAFPGGSEVVAAFASIPGYRRYAGDQDAIDAPSSHADSTESFLGNLPDKLQDCILRGKHVLLTGPTATGKTLAVEEVCIALGAPLTVVRGSEGLEDRDLIASISIVEGNTVTQHGPIPEAMLNGRKQYEQHCREVADARREKRDPVRIPPAVLLIDEINRLQLRFQNFLVSAMNVRKATQDYYLRIPDTNEEIGCPDGFLVIIAARNVGSAFLGTNPMDLALERRFFKKIQVDYLPIEQEIALVQARTGLDELTAKVLCKVAADTRYQLSQLKAPLDTDTLLKWAEELAWLKANGSVIDHQAVLNAAKDVIFDICLERSEHGGYDPAGEAVLTDNVSESRRDVFGGH